VQVVFPRLCTGQFDSPPWAVDDAALGACLEAQPGGRPRPGCGLSHDRTGPNTLGSVPADIPMPPCPRHVRRPHDRGSKTDVRSGPLPRVLFLSLRCRDLAEARRVAVASTSRLFGRSRLQDPFASAGALVRPRNSPCAFRSYRLSYLPDWPSSSRESAISDQSTLSRSQLFGCCREGADVLRGQRRLPSDLGFVADRVNGGPISGEASA